MTQPKLREVFPGIFLLCLPLPMKPTIVNVYLVRGGDEWALIDTGINSADSLAALREALPIAGCALDRLRAIICTHHHPDHFGAAKPIKELTGATLYLHSAEYERALNLLPSDSPQEMIDFFLANGVPLHRFVHAPRSRDFFSSLYAFTAPDVGLDDGDVIQVGDRAIEVVWTPGHAPGHCVFYLRDARVMIAGDHLLPKITPHVGYGLGSVANPLRDFLGSQRKIQSLDVDLVLPAHGGVFHDHRRRANQIIQHHHSRLNELLDILRRCPQNAYDVARKAFAFDVDSPITYQFPATYETLAHLEYLRHEDRVACDERDGMRYYRVV